MSRLPDFSDALNDSTFIQIGTPIYVRISWNIKNLSQKLRFYIKSCQIEQSSNRGLKRIRIIEDNCYSKECSDKKIYL